MSTIFETVRENVELTPEQRFQQLIESKRVRSKNLENLGVQAVTESQQCSAQAELDQIDEACAAKEEKLANLDRMREACKAKRIKEGSVGLEDKLTAKGKKTIMEMVIFEMVYNAYVADDDFKNTKVTEMFETFKEQMTILESKCNKKPKTRLMEEVENIVEEVCRKAAKRIATKELDEIDSIDFGLCDEEEEELDAKLADLGKEEIENYVKDKVVKVIQDEKQQNIRKSELIDEIDTKISEIEGDKTEDSDLTVEESFTLSNLNKKKTNIRTSFGDTLFNSIMTESTIVVQEAAVTEGIDVGEARTDIMNTALLESILKYTVLEMTNTLGLYEFDKYTIESLSKQYAFRK